MRLDPFKWAGLSGMVMVMAAAFVSIGRGLIDQYTWIPLGAGLLGLAAYFWKYGGEALALIRSRRTRHGANALVLTLAVMTMFAFSQAIISNQNLSWDLSKNKVHSLSDQTIKALEGLEQDIMAYHFSLPSANAAREEAFLKKLRALNPSRFKYQLVNPNKEPLLAEQYSVKNASTTVLVVGDRHETFSGSREEDLINALNRVTSTGTKFIYVLGGHQEVPMQGGNNSADSFKRALENGAYLIRELNLLAFNAVPDDAAAVVIAGPRTALAAVELERLKAYLARGGRMMIALDPRMKAPGLRALVRSAGGLFAEDVVVDPIAILSGAQPIMPPATDFDKYHAVTKGMLDGQIILPITRSLSLLEPAPEGVIGTVLARSTGNAWGYGGKASRVPVRPGPNDKRGPLPLALALEAPTKIFAADSEDALPGLVRMIVLGTSRMISNQSFGIFNNQDFILNSVRWLSGEEKKISIAPKDPENTPLILSRNQLVNLLLITLLGFPGAALLAGIFVYFRRRRAL